MRDYKRTFGSAAFDAVNVFVMLVLVFVTLYPFLFVVSRSFMSEGERVVRPYALIPREGINIEGYKYIFSAGSKVITGFSVTFFRVIVGTVLSVVVEAMFAYALSKKYYPMRGPLTVMIAITMWFGGGLIPSFLVVRMVGLYNSIWVYVLAPLLGAWGIIVMRTFFSQLPESLEESAKLDGANDITILFRIVFPLSTAVLATMALFSVVYHWNEWFMGIIYVSDPKKLPGDGDPLPDPPPGRALAARRHLVDGAGAPLAVDPHGAHRGDRVPGGRRVPVLPEVLHQGDAHWLHQGLGFSRGRCPRTP